WQVCPQGARRHRQIRSGRSPLTAYRRSAADIPTSESVVPIEKLSKNHVFRQLQKDRQQACPFFVSFRLLKVC
ncbi:MAG TPA: hypothetical protein H9745_10650, partial [Candidatus Agathobaculum stercoravium]|nr:hypothetical protein [Candidatus Agathobaculum stercoravium]